MATFSIGANKKPQATITRINNTTQYAVGDVINGSNLTTPLNFTISREPDKPGWIVGGRCVTNGSVSTQPNIDLLLFDTSSGIAGDNSAFDPGSLFLDHYIGRIKFNSWNTLPNGAFSDASVETSVQFTPETGSQIIYGVPLAQNTYTPISAERLTFSLDVEQY